MSKAYKRAWIGAFIVSTSAPLNLNAQSLPDLDIRNWHVFDGNMLDWVDSKAACMRRIKDGVRWIPDDRSWRFVGKVSYDSAYCRGGQRAVDQRHTPWLDWGNYWGTGGVESLFGSHPDYQFLSPDWHGLHGALIDLEYERIELIKFNLFDQDTYEEFIKGNEEREGSAIKVWDTQRLPSDHPAYQQVGANNEQLCQGELIRGRTLTGICNDIFNPLMGSIGQPFARNVQFEETFVEDERTELTKNRHGGRIGLMSPDPQLISRRLFTREQSKPELCNEGKGLPGSDASAHCDYKKAPFMNIMSAYWIQFMTHDWFAHVKDGYNSPKKRNTGCQTEQAKAYGCRPGDAVGKSLVSKSDEPESFEHHGKRYIKRAPKTFANHNTAWWDGSQIYGYDEQSAKRVKRDPNDQAKLLMVQVQGAKAAGDKQGYLPLLEGKDPMHPAWRGQEASGFIDNWTVGLSFLHNVFAREHNQFVSEFREYQRDTPRLDSGLRDPSKPEQIITYAQATDEDIFRAARLVVSASIAKIHTIEWTTQLLYNEPLYRAMNSNWNGLFEDAPLVSRVMDKIIEKNFADAKSNDQAAKWYSVFASGPGIFGLGNRVYQDDQGINLTDRFTLSTHDVWSLDNPKHVNGGVNHFGSPFNFPEEFVTVYRLHPLIPDLLEYRELEQANTIANKVPVVETFRGKATPMMREKGLSNWALSLGRQRLGLLTLHNDAQFLQNLEIPHLKTATNKLDVVALDIIRDRERGITRYNEFRRQYGLRSLKSFDDFVDSRLAEDSPTRKKQQETAQILRDIYGTHTCDASKVITHAQRDEQGHFLNDCLGFPNGTVVDNIEDLDTTVGWLAENVRPHGFAISETQFVVFILNASRRLFSDRFFTSSFRPEFYSHLGISWVNDNGPNGKVFEKGYPNGHKDEMSPMKRVLLRTMPELAHELEGVVNAFDPWARDRSGFYSLKWRARPGAEADPAFAQ